MSIDSVISNTINNILIGDMYLSARNAEGQEFAQIYPERLEKIYTHKWKKDKIREERLRLVEYKDEAIEFSMRVYCKIKIKGKLTTMLVVEECEELKQENERLREENAALLEMKAEYELRRMNNICYGGQEARRR